MLKAFRTARYQNKLNKVSGIFKAPPELVKQVTSFAAKDFAEHVLYYVNLGMQTEQKPNKAYNEMRNIILQEIYRVDILKGAYAEALNKLDSLRVGETMYVKNSDWFTGFAEKYELGLFYKILAITKKDENTFHIENKGFDELPKYKTYKKDGTTGNIENAIQMALVVLSDDLYYFLSVLDEDKKPLQHETYFATREEELIELSLIRKRCLELGAEKPNAKPVVETFIDVDLKGWIYNNLLESTPDKEKVSDNILKYREALTEVYKLLNSDETSTNEFYFKNDWGNTQSISIEKDPKNPLKFYINQDGRLSDQSFSLSIIENIIANAFFHTLSEKEQTNLDEDLHLEKRRFKFKYLLGDKLTGKLIFLRLNRINLAMIYSYDMKNLGAWFPKERRIALRPHILPSNIKTLEEFNFVLNELYATAIHEVQHYGQSVLTQMRALKEDEGIGLSPPKLRSKEYYPTGVNRKNQFAPLQEHPLRDIEYQTNTGSHINQLNNMRRLIHSKAFKYFVAVYVGLESNTPRELLIWEDKKEIVSEKYNIPMPILEEVIIYDDSIEPNRALIYMKEKDPKRWKAVVSEIIKEVL